MQFLNLVLVAATVLSVPIQACKCLSNNGSNFDSATEAACNKIGGEISGNDCVADSISEQLSDFRRACEEFGAVGSDCSCPVGCREAITAEEHPLAVAAHEAHKALVAKSA